MLTRLYKFGLAVVFLMLVGPVSFALEDVVTNQSLARPFDGDSPALVDAGSDIKAEGQHSLFDGFKQNRQASNESESVQRGTVINAFDLALFGLLLAAYGLYRRCAKR